MNIVAVAVEYNPPHLGHSHQLKMIKEKWGKNTQIILVMSGDFCQRGTVSLFPKETKARLAIKMGADLVIQLPTPYVLSSANFFAEGVLNQLAALNTNLTWVFGSFETNLLLLKQIALTELILENNELFQKNIRSWLKNGYNYPAAFTKSVLEFCQNKDFVNCPEIAGVFEKYVSELNLNLEQFLSDPNFFISYQNIRKEANSILGIEYIKSWYRLGLVNEKARKKIKFAILQRDGQAYRDLSIPELSQDSLAEEKTPSFASASSISNYLAQNNWQKNNFLKDNYLAKNLSPHVLYELYLSLPSGDYASKNSELLFPNDLHRYLISSILSKSEAELCSYAGMTEDKVKRLLTLCQKKLADFSDLDSFYQAWASKNYTQTSLARSAMAILLGLKKDEMQTYLAQGIKCLPVLALSKNGRRLLKILKKNANLPLIFSQNHPLLALEKKISFMRMLFSTQSISNYFSNRKFKSYLYKD